MYNLTFKIEIMFLLPKLRTFLHCHLHIIYLCSIFGHFKLSPAFPLRHSGAMKRAFYVKIRVKFSSYFIRDIAPQNGIDRSKLNSIVIRIFETSAKLSSREVH